MTDEVTLRVKKRTLLIAASALVAIAAGGIGGYLIGEASGEDLEAARSEGQAEGQKEGSLAGTSAGFADGRAKGREEAFDQSYATNYRRAYAEAFMEAGLTPPENIEVGK